MEPMHQRSGGGDWPLARIVGGRCVWRAVFAAGALLWAAGCAQPTGPATVPTGKWEGRGWFAYEDWEHENDSDDPQSISRQYDTYLTIEPAELEGHEVIKVEIVSERGELPGVGEQTHLIYALERAKQIDEQHVLYRAAGALFNPDPDDTLTYEEGGPPYAAGCYRQDNDLVLIIRYGEDWFDVFRFAGGRVLKTGAFQNDDGLVHWIEALKRVE